MNRRPSATRRAVLAAALAMAAVLAGCTGVPGSSSPSVVGPVALGNSSQVAGPPRDVSARTIVTTFLDANALPPSERASASAFLTPTAKNSWSYKTATVLSDVQVGVELPGTDTVEVSGHVQGTIDQYGVYTTALPTGSATTITKFKFTLTQVRGQYRIDSLQPGLLISDDAFRANFQQHVLYFYDLDQNYLVPDLRWSAIPTTDVDALSGWLVDQLVAGPRPALQNSVSSEPTFPAQSGPDEGQVRVVGTTMRVEIPGSSQLTAAVLDRLAAQLAYTLDFNEESSGDSLEITDGGRPVRIPAAGGALFTEETFPTVGAPVAPDPELYYVDAGRVVQGGTAKPVSGALGDGATLVDTVAVARRGAGRTLTVAATRAAEAGERLYVGTQSGGLQPTSVTGSLSRPCWAPGRSEVWVGDGGQLDRVTVSGSTAKAVAVALPSITPQRVLAVRLSPDGSQIALVMRVQGSQSLWIGAVARQGATVRVNDLAPISPQGIVVLDAGWSNSQRLIAIGYQPSDADAADVFETGVDGSFWTPTGIDNMPTGAVSLAVSNYGAWAEAGGQVWQETGTTWSSPSPTGSAPGSAPVYLG